MPRFFCSRGKPYVVPKSEDLHTFRSNFCWKFHGKYRWGLVLVPIASMYGIFSYIYHKNQTNVGKYTIHGWYGVYHGISSFFTHPFVKIPSHQGDSTSSSSGDEETSLALAGRFPRACYVHRIFFRRILQKFGESRKTMNKPNQKQGLQQGAA